MLSCYYCARKNCDLPPPVKRDCEKFVRASWAKYLYVLAKKGIADLACRGRGGLRGFSLGVRRMSEEELKPVEKIEIPLSGLNLISFKIGGDEDGGLSELVVQSTEASLEEVLKVFEKAIEIVNKKHNGRPKDNREVI